MGSVSTPPSARRAGVVVAARAVVTASAVLTAFAMFAAFAVFPVSGCRPSSSGAGEADGAHEAAPAPAQTQATAPAARTPTKPARTGQEPAVVFRPAGKPPVTVVAEVVRTPRAIRRGMMYRRHLAADSGMLFLMDEERVHTFWMRNTLIPLDMIFITRDMTVAGVVADARPLTDESRYVPTPSLYVLEVNGGWAAAHGITAGTPVEFQRVGERPDRAAGGQ